MRSGLILALLAGAVAGAATLVRPSWMLFLPFAFTCGLIYGQRRKQLLLAVAMFAGFVVVMLPWWVRNYRVTGHFVPTTLQVGASLYDGWNPQATGASDMRFVPEFEAAQRTERRGPRRRRRLRVSSRPPLPPGGLGLGLREPGPGRAACRNQVPADLEFLAQRAVLCGLAGAAGGAGDLPAADAAGRVGFAAGASRGWPGVLCWLPAVYFSLLHTVFVSSIRYRQPAMLGLIVLAAGYLAEFMDRSPSTDPRNGIAAILPKRLINFCWFWFKWGLIACVIGAALLVPYFYHRMDEEIRRRVEELLAKQYPGLQVKIHSAVLMKGEGIALRGLSIIDPAAEGPGAELLSYDECFLACPTDLSDLCSGQLKPTRVIVRRPTLRMTRRPDGTWSAARLLPLPKLNDNASPEVRFENGTIEIFDPTKAVACTLTLRDVNLTLSPIAPADGQAETTRRRRIQGTATGDYFHQVIFDGEVDPDRPALEPRRQDRRRGDFARDAQCPARCLGLQSFRAGLVARADRGPLPGQL